MVLDNKLGLTNSAELAKQEEILTKKRAKELFESGKIEDLEIGTFQGLSDIHRFLFQDIYDFAGKIREVNIAKGNFQFAPRIFLAQTLEYIDKLPQETFDEIIDKYSDMNVAHPFREGNGRATRIWLDLILKNNVYRVITAVVDLLISLLLAFVFIKFTSRTFNVYDISKIFIYGIILALILYYFFYIVDGYVILGPIKKYKDKQKTVPPKQT